MITIAQASGHPALDHWNDLINTLATHYEIEPNLVKATIEYESRGNPNIIGASGRGLGLMQIDYGTYKVGRQWYYSGPNGKTDRVFDPQTNILIGVRDFMVPIRNAFPNNIDARIAAYNAGIAAVQDSLQRLGDLTTVTYAPWYIPHIKAAYGWFSQQAPLVA